MDRLARNLDDLRRIVQQLTSHGVRIEFVKEQLTFTGEDSPLATLLLSAHGGVGRARPSRGRKAEAVAVLGTLGPGSSNFDNGAPSGHSRGESARVFRACETDCADITIDQGDS